MSTVENVLQEAAEAGLRAPSILNSQPWRWRLSGRALELWADRDRRLPAIDPDGRLLTVSCGAALQHALVTLAAAGHEASVERRPDPAQPDLLARLTLTREVAPDYPAIRAARAIKRRRTDRRPFLDTPISDASVACLRRIAEAYGVRMDELAGRHLLRFRLAAEHASEVAAQSLTIRSELAEWTHRPPEAADGVLESIPLRSFLPDDDSMILAPGRDSGARFFVLSTETDDDTAWLATGEAISAVLLEATADGLGACPLTDVVEVPGSRDALRRLIGEEAEPQSVLRIGIPGVAGPPPPSPRRAAQLVIAIDSGGSR